MIPKHQYHLSQLEDYVYSAQSRKESKLLCESMFVSIDEQTLFLKMVEREVFLCNQSINIIYTNKENVFMVPNHDNNGDYYVNPCLFLFIDEL